MKHIKYVEIKLRTSELTTFLKSVPVWEVPVIELVHGAAAIEHSTEHLRSIRQKKRHRDGRISEIEVMPTGAAEYERLAKRYRKAFDDDGAAGQLHVALIYGQFGVGEHNLQRAINEATVDVDVPADNSDLTGEEVSSVGG